MANRKRVMIDYNAMAIGSYVTIPKTKMSRNNISSRISMLNSLQCWRWAYADDGDDWRFIKVDDWREGRRVKAPDNTRERIVADELLKRLDTSTIAALTNDYAFCIRVIENIKHRKMV